MKEIEQLQAENTKLKCKLKELEILTPQQLLNVDNILNDFSQGNKITIAKLSVLSGLEPKTAQRILQILSYKGILETKFAVYCPQCEIVLKYTDNLVEINDKIFCHSCEETVDVSCDDIEVVYIFKACPFVKRQQKNLQLTSSVAAETVIFAITATISLAKDKRNKK